MRGFTSIEFRMSKYSHVRSYVLVRAAHTDYANGIDIMHMKLGINRKEVYVGV
jgi:hypothetical protein